MSEEFVVHDRRLFGKDGQVKEEPEAEEPKAEGRGPEAGPRSEEPAAARSAENDPGKPAGPRNLNLPPPSFPSLLVGLATSALIHLGESPDGAEPGQVDLPAAKQAIDLLGILKTKTRGNLENEEEALLETLLYDLRLKYVKASKP
jgi:hypothetical protein